MWRPPGTLRSFMLVVMLWAPRLRASVFTFNWLLSLVSAFRVVILLQGANGEQVPLERFRMAVATGKDSQRTHT